MRAELQCVRLPSTATCYRQVREEVVLACRAALSSLPKHTLMEGASPHMEEVWRLLADST